MSANAGAINRHGMGKGRNSMRPIYRTALAVCTGVAVLAGIAFSPRIAAAETVKIGTLRLLQYSAPFIAQEKGYFSAEGIDAQIVLFEVAEPAALGVVSGDLDFVMSGTSAALFTLGGQGTMRIIAGIQREVPTFRGFSLVASNNAYEAGLKSYTDLAGHSVTVTQIGSPPHYALALLAEKYGLDLKTMRVLALQTIPNEISALTGGQADAGLLTATSIMTPIDRGSLKFIGWVGDEVQWQGGVVATSTATANGKRDLVERFLRALRKGARDYHDAFTGPGETRQDGPTAPEILALLAKFTGQTPQQLEGGIAYLDRDARIDPKDILHQIAWFRAQGMVKGDFDPESLIDKRYIVPLPEK
jgi:NitT/TauT family transport system substrate-binding protein